MSTAPLHHDPIQNVVQEILKRLAQRIGGTREVLLVVVTGATVGLQETITELQNLIARGFTLRLMFSDTGEQLTGEAIRAGLAGYPHWQHITHPRWFTELQNADGVVVPMMSINALSKLSMLIADTPSGNVMLHALFSGMPLVLAVDGVEQNEGRLALGFGSGNSILQQAVTDRLVVAQGYGAKAIHVSGFASSIDAMMPRQGAQGGTQAAGNNGSQLSVPQNETSGGTVEMVSTSKQVISGADVRAVHARGAGLICSASAVLTPLAREIATQLGVNITRNRNITANDGGLTS